MPVQSSSQNTQGWKYLGFNYASWWNGKFANAQSTEALAQMSEIGADTSTIVASSYLDSIYSSEIYSTNNTESLANVEKAIVDSHNAGLQVWLKPHIDTAGEWRGKIDPSDRGRFFENYKEYLLDYAQLAQKHNVEALVVGTELNALMKSSDRGYWLDVIDAVKEVYDGKLTYAANWDYAAEIPFVDALDFIGVDAYYPLTENRNASVEQLVEAWTGTPENSYVRRITGGEPLVDWLRGLSEAADKPIVFTEVGFRSVDGNAAHSYEHSTPGAVDLEEQRRLYESFFQVFGDEPWFDGAQLWAWYATEYQNNDPSDTDYAILDKPAEEVFRRYASQLLTGNDSSDWPTEPTPDPEPEPAPDPVAPESPTPPTDLGDIEALDIAFEVGADWGDGFSGDVEITNTGDTTIRGWTMEFEVPYSIGETWNADVESLGNNRYRVTASADAPWNVEIAPGETLSFGFVGNASTPSAPTNFAITGDGLTDQGSDPMPPAEPEPEPPADPTPEPPTEPEVPDNSGDGDALDIGFDVTADWGTGFSGDVEITNTGDTPLQNWTVEFETAYTIGSSWNADIESLGNNRYRATASADAPWNTEIAPGQTLTFGFLGNAATPSDPINFTITSNGEAIAGDDSASPLPPMGPEVPADPETPTEPEAPIDGDAGEVLDVAFEVSADWGSGFSGDVQLTNSGDTAIDNWTIEFETDYPLGQTWNADITPLGNNRYRVTASADAPWNAEIAPGETISFGFVGNSDTPTAPSNYEITGDGLTGSGLLTTTPPDQAESPETPLDESDPVTEVEPEIPTAPSQPEEGALPPATDPILQEVEFGFQVTADWGDGFSGDVLVTNVGDTVIEDWSLGFDTAYTLGNAWNADIEAFGNNQYQAQAIGADAWNADIAPGETISFGFVGNAETPTAPTDFELLSDGVAIATDAGVDAITGV